MHSRRGSILILVLFVMTVLGLAALSFAYRVGLESRSVRDRAILTQLKAQAGSAGAIALARLKENTNDFDHRGEPWHAHAPLPSEEWLPDWLEDENGQPSAFVTDYQVVDEEGKLNVLFAASDALEKLGMSPEQISSLIDWMDGDDVAGAEGAENEYYRSRPKAYSCKNAPLETLEELLLVRGFAPGDYLGEDANHNEELDPEENDGSLSYPPDNADGKLRLGWVDLLTCVGDGRINLNTTPRTVLQTLPITAQAVDQIVAYRAYDEHSQGSLEDHVFRSAADIEQLQGLTEADVDVLKALTTFRSAQFRIFAQSVHVKTGLRYDLEVLVRLGPEGPEVLQWRPGLPP